MHTHSIRGLVRPLVVACICCAKWKAYVYAHAPDQISKFQGLVRLSEPVLG